MKKLFLIILTTLVLSRAFSAVDVNDLVIVVNPNAATTPGEEASSDLSIIFYDANGKQISVPYSYNAATGTITMGATTGNVFVVIVNKKTGKARTMHVVVTPSNS